jgi:hypothetical protein
MQSSERQRLAELYSGLSDEELLEIAEDENSLTDLAKEAVKVELARRELKVQHTDSKPDVEPNFVLIRQFTDLQEAVLARSLLDAAGVEFLLTDENISSMSLWSANLIGGIKLYVRQKDAGLAENILNGLHGR